MNVYHLPESQRGIRGCCSVLSSQFSACSPQLPRLHENSPRPAECPAPCNRSRGGAQLVRESAPHALLVIGQAFFCGPRLPHLAGRTGGRRSAFYAFSCNPLKLLGVNPKNLHVSVFHFSETCLHVLPLGDILGQHVLNRILNRFPVGPCLHA